MKVFIKPIKSYLKDNSKPIQRKFKSHLKATWNLLEVTFEPLVLVLVLVLVLFSIISWFLFTADFAFPHNIPSLLAIKKFRKIHPFRNQRPMVYTFAAAPRFFGLWMSSLPRFFGLRRFVLGRTCVRRRCARPHSNNHYSTQFVYHSFYSSNFSAISVQNCRHLLIDGASENPLIWRIKLRAVAVMFLYWFYFSSSKFDVASVRVATATQIVVVDFLSWKIPWKQTVHAGFFIA